jgi:hypothetical protein
MLTAVLLAAATAALADSPPKFSPRIEAPIVLATLRPTRAARLDGHRGTFVAVPDPEVDQDEDTAICECIAAEGVEVIILPPEGVELGAGAQVVEGKLWVRHIPGFVGPVGAVPPLVQVVVFAEKVR